MWTLGPFSLTFITLPCPGMRQPFSMMEYLILTYPSSPCLQHSPHGWVRGLPIHIMQGPRSSHSMSKFLTCLQEACRAATASCKISQKSRLDDGSMCYRPPANTSLLYPLQPNTVPQYVTPVCAPSQFPMISMMYGLLANIHHWQCGIQCPTFRELCRVPTHTLLRQP